jgi:hypothetical protein
MPVYGPDNCLGKRTCRAWGKNFIRLDTWADNQNLIHYFVNFVFNYLGIKRLWETSGLPKHDEGNFLSLFE